MLAVTCGRALACALVLCCTVSCVEKEGGTKIDPAYVKKNLLTEAPATLDNRIDADLGGKVVYLGNEVDSEVLRPGGAARVVHYWQVIEPPGSEWRVFTHLNGSGRWMNLDATDMRSGHPPASWQAGQVIRDEQRFTLDAGWTGDEAVLSVGLYRKGGTGAGDRMPIVSGPKDGESRVPVARFQVENAGASAEASSEVVVRRASGPIEIDGRADEPAWKKAPKSPAFSPAEGGTAMPDHTAARLLWDDEHLYAFIEATDDDVHSQYTEHDDSLWKEDVVELFIDADGNGHGYVELQVNPNNAQLDAWFPRTRAQKSHFEWKADMRSAVVVHGTTDDRKDTDRGYDVEIAIPLAAVKGLDEAMDVAIPPALGDRWRLNVVRVEKPADGSLMASSWNPIPIADFHALDRMLTVVFGDEDGATAAAAPADEESAGEPAGGAAATEEPAAPAAEEARRPLPTGTGRRSEARDLRMKAAKDRARAADDDADPRRRRPVSP